MHSGPISLVPFFAKGYSLPTHKLLVWISKAETNWPVKISLKLTYAIPFFTYDFVKYHANSVYHISPLPLLSAYQANH